MANIQIRITEEEKAEAQRILKSMGLTISGAVKMFLRKTVHDKKIPFEITADLSTPQIAPAAPNSEQEGFIQAQPNPSWTTFEKRKIG